MMIRDYRNFAFVSILLLLLLVGPGCYHREKLENVRCGDGVCDTLGGEDGNTCPADCARVRSGCGNSICDPGEDERTCPADCSPGRTGKGCGNGVCEFGEDHRSCPLDCPVLSPVCGDGRCEPGEAESCPRDCQ